MLLWLCILASWPSSLRAECPVTASGVCTPGVEETIVEDIVETTEYGADGYTVTTETTTTTTTTTVTTEDSGDILDGDNGFVASKYEGDMDIDRGGQGPANMPSGNNCYQLGTDKCAQITGSGNSTSTMGVSGMGTTFINTVDISELDIENGGRTNYTIKVDKRDSQDRIYMHITGRDGNTSVFSGTDILSESGVASGFQEYSGGFDFSGTITTVIIEIGGRDINMAIGPLFDDITINVLYNVVSTIVTQGITTVEIRVAMGNSTETEVIDIVENIFEHNDVVTPEAPGDDLYFEPEFNQPDMDVSYETVEVEMNVEIPEMEMASVEVEMDIEMEMELELPEPEMDMPEVEVESTPEPEVEETSNEPETTEETESDSKPVEESSVEDEGDTEQEEVQSKEDEESDEKPTEVEKKEEPKKQVESKKEKAAKKIVQKMGDKGRYDSTNQLKTLIVMQVLGDSKTFFESQKQLEDRLDFFTDYMIPDTQIENNNIAQWFLFGGSDGMMNDMIELQWQK